VRFLFHLLWRHLRQYPGRAASAILVLAMSSAFMLALAGVGTALRFRVGAYLTELFPDERMRLEASRAALGPMAIESRPITDDTVAAVRKSEGVKHVWPVEPVRFPIQAIGNLFGMEIGSDAVVHGVARELVADALTDDQPWAMPTDPEQPYPVVASRYFLDMYNLGLARAGGLPLLSPAAIVGKDFTLILGQSSVGLVASTREPQIVPARVAGLTSQPALIGLAMPAEVVRALNRDLAPGRPPLYVQLVVMLDKRAERDDFLKEAAALGLQLTGGDVIGGQLKFGVRLVGWVLIGLAAGVFAVGMLTFYLLFAMIFHARRVDLITLRAFGLTPGQVVGLALGEVGLLTLAAVGLATAANLGLFLWLSSVAARWSERLDWLPPGLFDLNIAGLLATCAGIFLLTLLPALPMLRWVVRVEPAEVIRDI